MTVPMSGLRFRFYPTLKQRRYLSRAFGTARHVFNWGLAIKREAYSEHKQSVGYSQLSRMLTSYRAEKPWLAEVTRQIHTQALRDLERAYQNFFKKRSRFPRYKSRFGAQSVRFQFDHNSAAKSKLWAEHILELPGIGKCRISDSVEVWPKMPAMVTVRCDACADYWISFATEAAQAEIAPDRVIGVDVGIIDLAVTSDGWKSGQLTALKGKAAQLRRYQRRVSRRAKGSKRRTDAKRRLARVHRRIANARRDFTHKASARVAASARVVVIETLNITGMLKNHCLARSLSDAALSEMHRQIKYKVARRGGTVICVDRWAPTSKVCSGCGHCMGEMSLSVRSWTCADCGSEHDRDVNAAMNLLALGRGTASMCGDGRGSGAAQVAPVLPVEPRISAAARRRIDRRAA
jgi:putative transposase